jgi:hypothetical protein
VENKHITVEHCLTDWMCADIFTKAFPIRDKWNHVRGVIAHSDPKLVWRDLRPAPRARSEEKSNSLPSPSAAPAPQPSLTTESQVGKMSTHVSLLSCVPTQTLFWGGNAGRPTDASASASPPKTTSRRRAVWRKPWRPSAPRAAAPSSCGSASHAQGGPSGSTSTPNTPVMLPGCACTVPCFANFGRHVPHSWTKV